uniref:Uncharacterized protein n=1 Tax=Glossina pallidipes TaxID=7398 RepID=A0A1B0AB65_GLOPL
MALYKQKKNNNNNNNNNFYASTFFYVIRSALLAFNFFPYAEFCFFFFFLFNCEFTNPRLAVTIKDPNINLRRSLNNRLLGRQRPTLYCPHHNLSRKRKVSDKKKRLVSKNIFWTTKISNKVTISGIASRPSDGTSLHGV